MTNQLQTYSKLKRATLIRLEAPTSTEIVPTYLYFTDFFRDIKINGIDFKANVVRDVKNVRFTKDLTAHKIKIQFSGLMKEQLDIVLEESASSYLNKTLKISQVFLDPSTEAVVGNEIVLFEGLISGSSLSDRRSGNNNSSVIEWECANHFQDFQQVTGRITDDFAHRGMVVVNGEWAPSVATKRPEYADDKGFFHANKSTNLLAQYNVKEKGFKLVKKKKWHGMSSSYSMKEYTEIVTKEVDIRFDLSAKFLPIVYGVQKVPGIPVFADTEVDAPSSVWVVYAVCEGEIEGFYDIHFGDVPILCADAADKDQRVCFGNKKTGSTINTSLKVGGTGLPETTHGQHYVYNDGAGDINIWTFHGTKNQLASEVLMEMAANNRFKLQQMDGAGAEYWDSSFKLLDTAYIICNYKLDGTDGGRTEIPSVEVEVKGKKVKKYSNGIVTSSNTTSCNPAWQLLDYLTSPIYGMSIPLASIDLPTFEAVAAKFDLIDDSYQADWVTFWRYIGWPNSDPSNRKIMQTNVTLQTEDTVFKNVGSMLDQTKSSLNKFGGKYILQVESDEPSKASIDLDTEAIGDISIKDLTGTQKFNTVTASLSDPAKNWQTTAVTFYDGNYKLEDRNVEKKLNLTFSYITNYYTARSMVDRELKKSRFSRSVSFTLPFYYIGLVLPDFNIDLSYKRYEWVNKKFLVDTVEIQYNGSIVVTAVEFPDSVFINSGQADVGTPPDNSIVVSVLPVRDLMFIPSINLIDPAPNVNGALSWLPSASTDVTHYSVYWEGAEEVHLVPRPITGASNVPILFDIVNIPIGQYVFTVRAIANNLYSAPRSLMVNIDPSKYLPDVQNFRVINLEQGSTVNFINNYVQLAWSKIDSTNPDIKYNLQIFNEDGTLIREVMINHPIESFIYTYDMNKADYTNTLGGVGAFRYLRFKIRAYGAGNAVSANWSIIN